MKSLRAVLTNLSAVALRATAGHVLLSLGLLSFVPVLVRADQSLAGNVTVTGGSSTGNLIVTGSIDSDGNSFTFGPGASPSVNLTYADDSLPAGASDTLKFSLNRISASWLWAHATDVTNPTGKAMRLDSAHQLILYKVDGATTGVALTPAANPVLSLGTATLTANGTALTANGALSVAGDISSTSATAKAAIGGAPNGTTTLTLLKAAGSSADGNLYFGDGVQWTRLNSNATNAAYNPMVLAGDHSYIFSNGTSGTGALVIAPWSSTPGTGLRMIASGNVGIGTTTTPLEKLHIKGNLMFESANSQAWRIVPEPTLNDRVLQFENNSSQPLGGFAFKATQSSFAAVRLKINNDGSVGVGTPTPASRLHVYGGAVFNQTAAGLAYYFGGNADGATNAKYSAIGMGSGGHITFNSSTDALAPTEFARFTATGSLGIGTSGPTAQLDVRAGGATSIYATTGGGGAWAADFHNLDGGGDRYVKLAGGTHAAVFMNGNVGIGTTGPAAKLDIVAGGNQRITSYTPTAASGISDFNLGGAGWVFSRPSDGSLTQAIYSYDSTGGTKNNLAISSRSDVVFTAGLGGPSGAPERMRISETGSVGIGTTNPGDRLEVSGGNVLVSGTVNPYIKLKSSATGAPYGFLQYDQSEGNFMRIFDGSQYSMVWKAGNVGVGTASPENKLHVMGAVTVEGGQSALLHRNSSGNLVALTGVRNDVAGEGHFTFYGYNAANWIFWNGNVGIGTGAVAPASKLHVMGVGRFGLSDVNTNNIGGVLVASGTGAGGARQYWIGASDPTAHNNNQFQISDYNGTTNSPLITIYGMHMGVNGGNVGIGTTAPTHKLSVKGTIRAQEIVVDNTNWADYVFEEDYRLAPLAEVESHIKAKGHLPGIPSAAEVAEHGVSMGDMQAKLLSKVEELTLHLIAQEKKLEAVTTENAVLRERVQKLETAAVTP
jgi:hypothetical protein